MRHLIIIIIIIIITICPVTHGSPLTYHHSPLNSFHHVADVDRCLCDGVTQGFVKITVRANTDEILGATICGPNAGDMISELTICMQYGIGVPQIAGGLYPFFFSSSLLLLLRVLLLLVALSPPTARIHSPSFLLFPLFQAPFIPTPPPKNPFDKLV